MERQDLTRDREKELEALLGQFQPRRPGAGHRERVLGPALAALAEGATPKPKTGSRQKWFAGVWRPAVAATVLAAFALGSHLVDSHYQGVVARLTSGRRVQAAELKTARRDETPAEPLSPSWEERYLRLTIARRRAISRRPWRWDKYAAHRRALEKLLRNGS